MRNVLEAIHRVFGDRVAPETRLGELRYVVFDTEFTSLESRTNRLLSIGAVVMEGGKIRIGEQFYRVSNPGVEVPGRTVVVHKIRTMDTERAEPPLQVLAGFWDFCKGAVLVGHFVQHDVGILDREAKLSQWGAKFRKLPLIDTAAVYRWNELHRRHYPVEGFDERTVKLDLASVAAHYGVTFEEAHHALADAFVTAQVWQKQLAVTAARGIETWKQLHGAIR